MANWEFEPKDTWRQCFFTLPHHLQKQLEQVGKIHPSSLIWRCWHYTGEVQSSATQFFNKKITSVWRPSPCWPHSLQEYSHTCVQPFVTQTHITTCTSLLPGHTAGLHFPAALAVRHGMWLPSTQWNEWKHWPSPLNLAFKTPKKKTTDSQLYVIYKTSTLNTKTAKLNVKEWRKICHENTNQSQVDSLY